MRAAAAGVLAFLAAAAPLAGAQVSSADLGGVFNDVGSGTRPLGMGGAFTAVADDANAVQENPAGMAFFDPHSHDATFTHSDLFNLGFLSRDFLAYAQGDQGYTALGFSLDRLSVDFNPGSWAEDEFTYAGAKELLGSAPDSWLKLAIGWQLKYLQVTTSLSQDNLGTSVNGGNAEGWGSGLGAMLKLGSAFSAGLMVEDLYSSLVWGTGLQEQLPADVRLGAAYHLDEQTLFSAEARGIEVSNGFGPDSYHIGAERWLMDGQGSAWGAIKNVGFRAGYFQQIYNYDAGVATVGASVKADMWQIDYTYEFSLNSEALGNTQRFGLEISF